MQMERLLANKYLSNVAQSYQTETGQEIRRKSNHFDMVDLRHPTDQDLRDKSTPVFQNGTSQLRLFDCTAPPNTEHAAFTPHKVQLKRVQQEVNIRGHKLT